MFYPRQADPSQAYETRFKVDVARELHAAKRLRAVENYRDHFVIPESWERAGDYWLLRYPSVPAAAPCVADLLRSLQKLVKARFVHGRLTVASLRGGRIADFAGALDMAGAVTHAADYFLVEGPPDRMVLGLVAQGLLTATALLEIGAPEYARFLELPREAAILELIRGWKTWDLYDLSGLVRHPLAKRCRSANPAERPTIEECAAALKNV